MHENAGGAQKKRKNDRRVDNSMQIQIMKTGSRRRQRPAGGTKGVNMLVAFSFENFRAFRDRQELNLVAGPSTELLENTQPFPDESALAGKRLLKSVVIYGANGAGKSTLVAALRFFFDLIEESANQRNPSETIDVSPFYLDKASRKKPTTFSATLLIDGVIYEYSYAVTRRRVESEELVAYPKKAPRVLFRRWLDSAGRTLWHFSRTHFRRDKQLEERTRENALYLSVCAQWNQPDVKPIYDWLYKKIYWGFEEHREHVREMVARECLEDSAVEKWVTHLLQEVDPSIEALRIIKADLTSAIPPEQLVKISEKALAHLKNYSIPKFFRRVPETGELVAWDIDQESTGTQRFFEFLHAWRGILHNQGTGILDELHTGLHPLLARKLIELINKSTPNRNVGQLIFATHDATLLDPLLFRRDQVYFVEKNAEGAAHLYSLLEFKPRKDEALEKGYLSGRYGGIPILRGFSLDTPTSQPDEGNPQSREASKARPEEIDSGGGRK
jgi:AAA15 family ATPase/GTPase